MWIIFSDFLLPGLVLEGYTFLRVCPFLPSCPFFWHIVAHRVSYNLLYFCVVYCDFSIFISNFIDLILLPFFSWWVWLTVCLFCYLLKEPAFTSVDLCYSLLCLFFTYFCTDFYDFFPSVNFGVFFFVAVLLFLVTLGVKLGCLFDVSLVSWGRLVLPWISLLALLLLNPVGFRLLCFHFYFFLCIFLFPFWLLPWSVGYLEACCLASRWLDF